MSACVLIYLAWLEMVTLNDHLERSNYYWTTFSASAFPCFDFVSFKCNKFHNILHCDGIFQLHFAAVSTNVVGGKWAGEVSGRLATAGNRCPIRIRTSKVC